MRNATKLVIALGLLLSVSTIVRGEDNSECGNLISRLQWAQFDVVQGRLVVRGTRYVRNKTLTTIDPLVGTRETLTVSPGPTAPSVRYELATADEDLLIQFEGGDHVSICRQIHKHAGHSGEGHGGGRGPCVVYHQPSRGPITLKISNGRMPPRVVTAESLWHLLIIHEATCREHLLPILERIRPGWRLMTCVGQIENNLLRIARTDWLPAEAQWSEYVMQLGSDDFRQRQSADRSLRGAGQAVLPFLDGIDPTKLDVEQRLRILRIRDALSLRQGDEPQRVAIWLNAEPTIWVSLLSHETCANREIAARRLTRLSGRHIAFDPHAAPELRARQIRELSDLLVAD